VQVLEGGSNVFFPLSSSNQSRRNVLNSLQFIMLKLREAIKYTVAVMTKAFTTHLRLSCERYFLIRLIARIDVINVLF